MSTLFRSFLEQVAALQAKDEKPFDVVFSFEGFTEALKQNDKDAPQFGASYPSQGWDNYCGLPFSCLRTQTEPLVVRSRESIYSIAPYPGGKPPVLTVKLNLNEPSDSLMSLCGSRLTQAEICDIVQAWAEAHPNSNLSVALRDAVRQHGRFE